MFLKKKLYISGVDDIALECELDDATDWDKVISNEAENIGSVVDDLEPKDIYN
jgi:hypothetical protein